MSQRYTEAGVNIAAGNEAARRYGPLAARTRRPEVMGGLGGFAGGFRLDLKKFPNPVLVSGTDGVGTKLKVAFATGRHDTVGIDCVAMCVNDILTSGAEPLFFLDYLAVGKLDVAVAETVVAGVAAGCEQAGCSLVGGETAEMPGMYGDGEYDLAGAAVGAVNEGEIVDGRTIRAGDAIIGLASNGLHSNGFSLVRQLVTAAGLTWDDEVPNWRGTVADELLRPTRIYVGAVMAMRKAGVHIKGMAHITGGGLVENLPRCLPAGCGVRLDIGSWPVPGVFSWLLAQSQLAWDEAARVWNLGVGYALVVDAADVEQVLSIAAEGEHDAYVIGHVVAGDGQVDWSGHHVG